MFRCQQTLARCKRLPYANMHPSRSHCAHVCVASTSTQMPNGMRLLQGITSALMHRSGLDAFQCLDPKPELQLGQGNKIEQVQPGAQEGEGLEYGARPERGGGFVLDGYCGRPLSIAHVLDLLQPCESV
jgi:hypothetical protein